jgi:hypothetical protein
MAATRFIPTRPFHEADKFGTRTAANWMPKACLVIKTTNSTYALNIEGQMERQTFVVRLYFGGTESKQESLNRHVDKPVKVSKGLEQAIYDALAFEQSIPDFSRLVGKPMHFQVKGLNTTQTSTVTGCWLTLGHATNFGVL